MADRDTAPFLASSRQRHATPHAAEGGEAKLPQIGWCVSFAAGWPLWPCWTKAQARTATAPSVNRRKRTRHEPQEGCAFAYLARFVCRLGVVVTPVDTLQRRLLARRWERV